MVMKLIAATTYLFVLALIADVGAATPNPVPPPSRAIVIHDAGGVPLNDILDQVVPETRKQYIPAMPSVPMDGSSLRIFPVRSPGAAPGVIPSELRNTRIQSSPGVPICIIGDDQLSRQWLRANLAMLRSNRIACIVASVRSEAAFKQLQFEAPDIRMVPSSIDGLVTKIGIKVWPILIGPDGRILQ